MVAQNFTKAFGQSFYVENKAGAGNLIGIEYVAKSAADGYTLFFVPSTLVLNPILYKTVNYDPIKDFSPISMVATTPNILVVNSGVKASNLKDFIKLASERRTRQTQLQQRRGWHLAPHVDGIVQSHEQHSDSTHPLQRDHARGE